MSDEEEKRPKITVKYKDYLKIEFYGNNQFRMVNSTRGNCDPGYWEPEVYEWDKYPKLPEIFLKYLIFLLMNTGPCEVIKAGRDIHLYSKDYYGFFIGDSLYISPRDGDDHIEANYNYYQKRIKEGGIGNISLKEIRTSMWSCISIWINKSQN